MNLDDELTKQYKKLQVKLQTIKNNSNKNKEKRQIIKDKLEDLQKKYDFVNEEDKKLRIKLESLDYQILQKMKEKNKVQVQTVFSNPKEDCSSYLLTAKYVLDPSNQQPEFVRFRKSYEGIFLKQALPIFENLYAQRDRVADYKYSQLELTYYDTDTIDRQQIQIQKGQIIIY